MRNLGDVWVSLDLLVDVLKLPQGTEILDVIQTPEDRLNGRMTLRVEHDSLPVHDQENDAVTNVRVVCKQVSCHYDWN